jgi:hypothetical protein
MQGDRQAIVDRFDDNSNLKKMTRVKGVKKSCILAMIKYHQIQHNLFEEVALHPATQKGLEELNYLLENNLPIEKEMLFKYVPELYSLEINEMGYTS